MRTAYYTHIGGRPANEDAIRLMGQGGAVLAVLADGVGGSGGGEDASHIAVATVCESWKGNCAAQQMADLAQKAHRAVQAAQTRFCAMKSTLVALSLLENKAAWVHAGDSRLYRFRNGRLEFQSRDHSTAQIAVMLGEITLDQIRFHSDRSKVIRALGQEGDLMVETGEALLPSGHYAFLLCSDGFWEYVYEREMEEDLAASNSPEEWLHRMRDRMTGRTPEHNDNNTAAVIWTDIG